jgi:hypothetical protein
MKPTISPILNVMEEPIPVARALPSPGQAVGVMVLGTI